MLPPFKECQRRIQKFDKNHPRSTFDEFWRYKLEVERNGASILDDLHLDETARLLGEKLLKHPKWRLARTVVASDEESIRILKSIRREYKIINGVDLGKGKLAADRKVQDAVVGIYDKLCGITHRRWNDSPDEEGRSYLEGKSKVLMFIWGQTPAFDSRLRETPNLWLLPHLWIEKIKYTGQEFCDILKELDYWVIAWEQREGKKFQQTLSPNRDRPAGRIIDIIYWTESHDCH